MAIHLIKSNRFKTGFVYDRREEFLLDSIDDLSMLPEDCAIGSTAHVVDMSVSYQMGENGWVETASGNAPTSGLPEGGAPYQQLVTDGEGNVKWEDREFYTLDSKIAIVPNATYGIFSSQGMDISGNFKIPTVGEEYHIVFGNTETDKIAVEGNRGVRIGENYNEFIIEIISETTMYVETSNTGPKVIEITCSENKKIGREFLPILPIATENEYGTIKIGELVGRLQEARGAEIFNEYFGANVATGNYSHAEGYGTEASGSNSHAEGDNTTASGIASHTEGEHTRAASENQHVQGRFNIEDSSGKYAHIVGNGYTYNHSNAHTLDWDGNGWFAGTIKLGGTGQDDEVAVEVATKADIPDTSCFVASPITATIGQTIVVKSVDENGKPTEWEAVDAGFTPDGQAEIVAQVVAEMLSKTEEWTFTLEDDSTVVKKVVVIE